MMKRVGNYRIWRTGSQGRDFRDLEMVVSVGSQDFRHFVIRNLVLDLY